MAASSRAAAGAGTGATTSHGLARPSKPQKWAAVLCAVADRAHRVLDLPAVRRLLLLAVRLLGALAAGVHRPRQLRRPAARPAVLEEPVQHGVLCLRLGAARPVRVAEPGFAAQFE